MNKDTVILYHNNCLDGFTASWVAWTKFQNNAEYTPVVHQMPIPDNLQGKTIYFLDFVYPAQKMKKIMEKAEEVIAIDHHKSEEETTKQIPNHLYDKDHSGSVLAWQYFYPDQKVPRFLQIVEDMDLWNFKFDYTDPIITYLETIDFDYKKWDTLVEEFEDDERFQKYVEKGRLLISYKDALVNRLIDKSQKVKFEGYEVLSVNSSLLVSTVGNKLYEKHPPFSIIWHRGNGVLKVSMRSNEDMDVSKIAKKYGGGGHPGSASFKLPQDAELPWKFINN